MSGDDQIRIRHMLDAARQAVAFAGDRTRTDLESDSMLMLSLVKLVEIVGETASQVSDAGRASACDIPWADIVGMRNRLVHAYFDINLNILWQTVVHDLPPLIAQLAQILGSETA